MPHVNPDGTTSDHPEGQRTEGAKYQGMKRSEVVAAATEYYEDVMAPDFKYEGDGGDATWEGSQAPTLSDYVSSQVSIWNKGVTEFKGSEAYDYEGTGGLGGGYDQHIQSEIARLLGEGEDPAIEAAYQRQLGQGYREAEFGAAARGVTGYGGLQQSKESVQTKAKIDRSRASMQQKSMNSQIAVQYMQQAFNNKQLSQEGALALSELMIGATDWVHAEHDAMSGELPGIMEKVAEHLEKYPGDSAGAAKIFSEQFMKAYSRKA